MQYKLNHVSPVLYGPIFIIKAQTLLDYLICIQDYFMYFMIDTIKYRKAVSGPHRNYCSMYILIIIYIRI